MAKILLVASNGGHLVQLLRLKNAFVEYTDGIVLVSTSDSPPKTTFKFNYHKVSDSNFSEKIKLLKTCFEALKVILRERPDLVVTTGAAPGLFCLFWNRVFFRDAIWFDSIANTEKLSLSGRVAKKLTKYCYSQWQTVAEREGVHYLGSIL